DSDVSLPGATLTLDLGGPITAQDSNGAMFADGFGPLGIVVLRNPDNSISLGCNEAEYVDAVITGKLVVTLRGTCARIVRAQFGQAHGAAAVAMINNAAGYPVFEGPIPGVTIPFLGILVSPLTNGTTLAAAANATFTNRTVCHPTWTPDDVRIAMVNTSDAAQLVGYSARLAGNGLVQPLPATLTSVVARGDNDAPSLSLGVQQFSQDFAGGGDITLKNNGVDPA